jgi:hypothetical protein
MWLSVAVPQTSTTKNANCKITLEYQVVMDEAAPVRNAPVVANAPP